MSDPDPVRLTVHALLDTQEKRQRTLRELEYREAQDDILDAPLTLRLQIDDLREEVAAAQARIEDLLPGLSASLLRQVHATRSRWLEEDLAHLQRLAALRQRKCDELERRAASHGPGQEPLYLVNSLAAERLALDELSQRRTQAAKERQRLAVNSPGLELEIRIEAPDGSYFETRVPAHVKFGQLTVEFLAYWNRPPGSGWVLYSWCDGADGSRYRPGMSLGEAGVATGAVLRMVPDTPATPIALLVEDPSGDRFECNVPGNLLLATLAEEFLAIHSMPVKEATEQPAAPVIEVVDSTTHSRSKRLDRWQSLADAGLKDHAHIRIFW